MNSLTEIPICRSSSRRSKPSEFANSIKQFKQTVAKSSRSIKKQFDVSQENNGSSQDMQAKKKGLYCLMGDGTRLKLQVLFSKTKPISKNTKIKIKEKSSPEPKPIVQKKPSVNEQNNLLFKFLNAFKEIQGQNFTTQKPVQHSNDICQSSLPSKRQLKEYKRKEKDQEDKCQKIYQKIKKLDEKFMEIQETLVYL